MTSFFNKLSAAILLGLVPVGLAAAPARADVFDGTFAGPATNLGGPVATGSGTLVTGAAEGAGFLVADITGTFGGVGTFALSPATPVPEPASLVLLAGGLVALGAVRRRKA